MVKIFLLLALVGCQTSNPNYQPPKNKTKCEGDTCKATIFCIGDCP